MKHQPENTAPPRNSRKSSARGIRKAPSPSVKFFQKEPLTAESAMKTTYLLITDSTTATPPAAPPSIDSNLREASLSATFRLRQSDRVRTNE